jgi:hypothetical protein
MMDLFKERKKDDLSRARGYDKMIIVRWIESIELSE